MDRTKFFSFIKYIFVCCLFAELNSLNMQHLWVLVPIALGVCLGKNIWLFSFLYPSFYLLQQVMIFDDDHKLNLFFFFRRGICNRRFVNIFI